MNVRSAFRRLLRVAATPAAWITLCRIPLRAQSSDVFGTNSIELTQYGFPASLISQMKSPVVIPRMTIQGYGGIGNSCCAFAFLTT